MWHGIQKNERLKIERGLFEEVMDAIVDGKTIVVLKIRIKIGFPINGYLW